MVRLDDSKPEYLNPSVTQAAIYDQCGVPGANDHAKLKAKAEANRRTDHTRGEAAHQSGGPEYSDLSGEQGVYGSAEASATAYALPLEPENCVYDLPLATVSAGVVVNHSAAKVASKLDRKPSVYVGFGDPSVSNI
jgi:hypothetical protein